MSFHPDATVYGVAALLTFASALLFGAAPLKQVLRTDPYQIVKSGARAAGERRIAFRDLLLAAQIAICAVLVTSSIVAVRGYLSALGSNFGFEPRNAMLMDTDLTMAGYRGDRAPAMQKRMLEAIETIPGVTSVAFVDRTPLNGSMRRSIVFAGDATDLRRSHAAADVVMYSISPGYFRTAGTALLSGRAFTWHDDQNAPRVAVINREFARRMFGSSTRALGGYYKLEDGARVQVVGIAADGKYQTIGEYREPAMFLPILQSPTSATTLIVRSELDPNNWPRRCAANCGNSTPACPVSSRRGIKDSVPLCSLRPWRPSRSARWVRWARCWQ